MNWADVQARFEARAPPRPVSSCPRPDSAGFIPGPHALSADGPCPLTQGAGRRHARGPRTAARSCVARTRSRRSGRPPTPRQTRPPATRPGTLLTPGDALGVGSPAPRRRSGPDPSCVGVGLSGGGRTRAAPRLLGLTGSSTRPSRRVITRSASSANSRSWVTITVATFSSRVIPTSRSTTSRERSWSGRWSLVTSSTAGSVNRARAMLTRWR